MKNLLLACLLMLLMAACTNQGCKDGVVRHVVLFSWNEDTSEEKVEELVQLFNSLEDKIDVIIDMEYGEDISIENLQRGFTHCFILTFKDVKGRNTYLPHPEHVAFGRAIRPHMKNVLVIDYVKK